VISEPVVGGTLDVLSEWPSTLRGKPPIAFGHEHHLAVVWYLVEEGADDCRTALKVELEEDHSEVAA